MTTKQNKDFDEFVGNLLLAYKQFCFSTRFSEKLKNHNFAPLDLFWFTTLLSLRKGYLSELSKLFEKQNGKFEDVLSIYYLLDYEFAEHSSTIEKLKKLRNKFLMHHDLKTIREFDKFMKELDLSPKNIQDLFIKTFEVVERIRVQYSISGELGPLFKGVEEKVEKEIDEILEKLIKVV